VLGRTTRALTVMVLVGALCAGAWLVARQGRATPSESLVEEGYPRYGVSSDEAPRSIHGSGTMTDHLPLVTRSFPPPPPQFGVQMHGISEIRGLGYLTETGNHWIRFNAFPWDRIEQEDRDPPRYDWSVVDEESLRSAADSDMEVIAVVRFTPEWAQKVEDSYCGPIKADALDDFAEFLTALVRRYSASPYNIRYWELGNEPDIDPSLVSDRSGFGCWGNEEDEYYGGGHYAEMLKVAYPAIKRAHPRAQVVLGGLLLDCDPTNPPAEKSCKPAKFLEGILRNGGGDYFDVVSFHGYPPYDGSLQLDEGYPAWETRGGVVLGKVDFLREVMAAYGVDKPLLHTEGSLICPEWNGDECDPPADAFYEAQADYVVRLFVRNWANGLLGTTWYQFEGPGWRYGGMLDGDQEPKPAYHAYDFLTGELRGATYEGEVTRYVALEAYAFRTPGKRLWVLWAPDEEEHAISLPGDTLQVLDKYGGPIPSDGSVTVSSPVYIELGL